MLGPTFQFWRDWSDVRCAAEMELLCNLLLSKTAVVASAHRLRNLKIARILQIERNGPIVREGFDHRYLQRNF